MLRENHGRAPAIRQLSSAISAEVPPVAAERPRTKAGTTEGRRTSDPRRADRGSAETVFLQLAIEGPLTDAEEIRRLFPVPAGQGERLPDRFLLESIEPDAGE